MARRYQSIFTRASSPEHFQESVESGFPSEKCDDLKLLERFWFC
jgi:hypothetical protein